MANNVQLRQIPHSGPSQFDPHGRNPLLRFWQSRSRQKEHGYDRNAGAPGSGGSSRRQAPVARGSDNVSHWLADRCLRYAEKHRPDLFTLWWSREVRVVSPDETGKFLGLLASLLAIFGWLFRNSMEMGQLRFQVKELWRVTFANAQVELVNRGLAKSESPIHIIPEGYEFFRPYINDFMP